MMPMDAESFAEIRMIVRRVNACGCSGEFSAEARDRVGKQLVDR